MKRFLLLAVASLLLAAVGGASATVTPPPDVHVTVADDAPPGQIEVVGHDPLMNRGMNAALAVHGDYAYVGSRTDGKPNNINNAGVMVVDISNPENPEVVHQIGPPQEANEGETSREMRIWPEEELLIVMNLGSNCSELIHMCSVRKVDDHFDFYDISGKNAAEPKLISTYTPSVNPHEFFLWDDPKRPGRALLFVSTPGGGQTQLMVTDISGARDKKFAEIYKTNFGPAEGTLHSLSVSVDGKTGYLAHLEGGYMTIDTSKFAKPGVKKPKIKVLTPPANAPKWGGPGAHSAIPLFGRKYVLVADEVYGEALVALGDHGCPWGWVRMIKIKNVSKPKVIAEYKLPQNEEDFCTTDVPRPSSSYSAHNPTLTRNLAVLSWHAGGLQIIDIKNPAKPLQAAEWKPDPEPYAIQEDPALTAGQDKVAVWSYPIIKDGLIYVVDIRNGLYILEYQGPFASEISKVKFLEGNSNLGDALKLGLKRK